MEEEDDDFYGGGAKAVQRDVLQEGEAAETNPEEMDVNADQNEEAEDEDDDDEDDIQITLDKPEGMTTQPAPSSSRPAPSQERSSAVPVKQPPRSATPVKQEAIQDAVLLLPPAVKGALTHKGKEGKDFPEIRSKTAPSLDSTPTWPANGKLITDLDIDADLAEHSKPWRLPGTDQTDFFNYGFDEYTWTQYCIKQQNMAQGILQQREADAQIKAMVGGGPGGPIGPSGGGGGGGMAAGMPDPSMMIQQMMAQGMDPSSMDFNQFMSMMNGGGGGGGGGMPPNMPNQGPQFPQGPSGFSNGTSPAPGLGQGFQPPQGPQGAMMEGYSPQQLAIMQDQQGPMGGRGRGRRGRGFY